MEQNDERRTYLGRVGDVTRRFRTARLVHARPDPVVMSMTVIVVVIIAIAVIVDDPRPADAAPSTARIERVDQLPPLGIVFPEASMSYRRYQFRQRARSAGVQGVCDGLHDRSEVIADAVRREGRVGIRWA